MAERLTDADVKRGFSYFSRRDFIIMYWSVCGNNVFWLILLCFCNNIKSYLDTELSQSRKNDFFFQISPPGGRLWSSIMRKRENRSQTKTRASTWVILVSTPMFSWSKNLIMSSIFCFKHSYAQLWSSLFSETEYFIYFNAVLELCNCYWYLQSYSAGEPWGHPKQFVKFFYGWFL